MNNNTFLTWHTWVLGQIIQHIQEHRANGETIACATALTRMYVDDVVFMMTPEQDDALQAFYGPTNALVKVGLLQRALEYLGLPCTVYHVPRIRETNHEQQPIRWLVQ